MDTAPAIQSLADQGALRTGGAMDVGQELKAMRQARGLDIGYISERLGIPEQTLLGIEDGSLLASGDLLDEWLRAISTAPPPLPWYWRALERPWLSAVIAMFGLVIGGLIGYLLILGR